MGWGRRAYGYKHLQGLRQAEVKAGLLRCKHEDLVIS